MTARRRVLLITEIIAPYRIPVFNALASNTGLDCHVIFLSETDATLRQWRVYKEEIGFSHEVLPSFRMRAGKRNWLVNRRVPSALRRRNPEVVMCGGYNYVAAWQAQRWAKRRRVPFLLWSESNLMDLRNQFAPVEFLKKVFVRRCDGFVVPGESAAEYLCGLGADASKITVAPNAVDNEFFEREALAARAQEELIRAQWSLPQRYILFVGRLVAEKGLLDLVDAYAALDAGLRAQVGLVIAGDGPLRDTLVERARGIRPGVVILPGFGQREILAKLYALAEVFVLPTHTDTWGLVVNEAMACGLPVIVTNVAGCARDLVEDGWNGRVVEKGDSVGLKEGLTSLLNNPVIEKQMADHSRQRIQNYSPASCARGLAEAAMRTLAVIR
jgi:glycosyltransferase involved in cell wall biosynthesis